LPVGAVAGFCNMLWKLLQDARDTDVGVTPTHFAVIFDYSSQTFRKELYPEYKANRSEPPEDLIPQFGLIREATKAFNLPCIEVEGYEADDIIATYARQAEAVGAHATIISSDKDLMQLVTDHVSMYDSMKDRQIGIAEVIEKFGVAPEKMIDLQALTGDSTDNIPGVPGIGPKTAAQLLDEYGDLDTLLERASEIKQNKRRENLIEFADQARLSRELVTLKTDTPLDIDLDGLKLEPQDGPKLIGFLKAMEFNTLTRRVAEATSTEVNEVEAADVEVEAGRKAHGPDLDEGTAPEPAPAAADDIERGALTPAVFADQRATGGGLREIRPGRLSMHPRHRNAGCLDRQGARGRRRRLRHGDQLARRDAGRVGGFLAVLDAWGSGLCAAQPQGGQWRPSGWRTGREPDSGGRGTDRLKALLEDESILVVGQNLKYDWLVMRRYGIEIASLDDTMLLSYVADAGTGAHGMDALAERWLGHTPIAFKEIAGTGKKALTFDMIDLETATRYAAEDADITLRLWQVLKPQVLAKGLMHVYERLERPLVAVLARMEARGISVDRQILSRLSGEFAQKAAAIEDEIYELAGERFNVGSPKQLGEILFGKMGLPGGSKTKSGQWATGASFWKISPPKAMNCRAASSTGGS
jgi:DNA polymerase-1